MEDKKDPITEGDQNQGVAAFAEIIHQETLQYVDPQQEDRDKEPQ
jgi:hypothetical protein